MRSTASRTVRAVPTLLRVGVAETFAYRAEFLVWLLTATQPLVMMSLWTSVARDQSFHGYTAEAFVAYYLSNLIVRQLTGSWVAWQMMEEVRMGTMAMRLLRPIHPFVAFLSSHVASVPFRAAVSLPIAVILIVTSGASALTHDPFTLAVLPLSIGLAYLITFMVMLTIGSLAFFMTETFALVNLYYGLYSLFSGYLLPLDLLPGPIASAARWLPFRFTLEVPVDIMTRPLTHGAILELLAGQAAWLTVMFAIALGVWRAGVRRFESVGG